MLATPVNVKPFVRRRTLLASTLLGYALFVMPPPARAQIDTVEVSGSSPATKHSTEWAFTTGGSADLPGGAKGGEFWALQLRWGKVLTAPHGPGPLRGTLEYAFELVPAMVLRRTCSSTAEGCGGSVYGGGFTPFFWQYNFTSSAQQRLVPYLNLGAGMLFTTQDFPVGTSSFNFTPQGGIGAHWFMKPGRAVNFGVRYHHISNAGITKPNPGHNSLYFYGGFSWWR